MGSKRAGTAYQTHRLAEKDELKWLDYSEEVTEECSSNMYSDVKYVKYKRNSPFKLTNYPDNLNLW